MASNLLKHLSSQHEQARRRHKQSLEAETGRGVNIKPKIGSPLDGFVKRITCPSGCAGRLTDTIVDLVALDLRQMSFISGVGFCRLLQVAESGYRVPLVTHVPTLLKKKHVEGHARLRKLLETWVWSVFDHRHMDVATNGWLHHHHTALHR